MENIIWDQVLGREMIAEQMKKTLRDFELNKTQLLHKRGIYIYGAPGSGKTEFVLSILKELNYDVVKYDTGDIRNKSIIDKYSLKKVELTDEEIKKDIKKIIYITKFKFNRDCELHIIPHLNLKLHDTNEYIPDRNKFIILLSDLCDRYYIKFHNIGKHIEDYFNDNKQYLNIYMPDSLHYSYGYDIVKKFLLENIIK
jgi:Cdc6-like AAA superfamily ATPase